MSRRAAQTDDRHDPDVVIAVYHYRHEAEFAAGFLANAGIPHRMQADDAGGADAGVTFSRPARIWVRRADAEAARELLEVTPNAVVTDGQDEHEEEDEDPPQGLFIPAARKNEPASTQNDGLPGRPSDATELCGAERAVAVLLGVAFGALGAGVGGIAPAGQFGAVWTLGMGLLGVAMLVSGLVGRSWGPLRSLLRALSGTAP
jgi:hypothetical protein